MNAILILDRRRAKADGTFPIAIDVANFNHVRILTGISCKDSEWDNGKLRKSVENYSRKSSLLMKYQLACNEALLGIVPRTMTNKDLTKILRDAMFPAQVVTEEDRTLIHYIQEYIDLLNTKGTRHNYETTLRKVLKFQDEVLHGHMTTIDELDYKWLVSFESWMSKTMSVNGYAIPLRNLRKICNYCLDCEYTDRYPFRRFHIKHEETRSRALSIEQLRTIIHTSVPDSIKVYKDIFLLSVYLCGISPVDLLTATPDMIEDGYLVFKRTKLAYKGRYMAIKIQPEAQAILNRYKGSTLLLKPVESYKAYTDFLHHYGDGLKHVGQTYSNGNGYEGDPIEPSLSPYWCRHTWATIAANMDDPLPEDIIALCMGHKRQSVTGIYIKDDQRKLDEANRRVLDYILEH